MYVRKANDRELTFCVSGMLWNRSLVMMDMESRSLWSHILGEAMDGPLKGTELEAIPSDMVTWEAWRREHPKSTVLDLPRTARDYTRRIYRGNGRPRTFAVGFQGKSGVFHCGFATLEQTPLLNVDAGGLPLVITFDPQSTSLQLYARELDGRVLSFDSSGSARMRDRETGSTWERTSGVAIEGALKGKRLEPYVGIVSFTRAWLTFHPDSQEIK